MNKSKIRILFSAHKPIKISPHTWIISKYKNEYITVDFFLSVFSEIRPKIF